MNLFRTDVDWRKAAASTLDIPGVSEGEERQMRRDILKILTTYNRYGSKPGEEHYTREGELIEQNQWTSFMSGFMAQMSEKDAQEAAKFAARESIHTGASSPESFFTRGPVLRGTPDMVADLWFLQVCPSTTMVGVTETREEWNMDVTYVRMDQFGQVQFAKFQGAETSMYNYEYGAGVDIQWTWFETNVFGIKMNRLAPKFRYEHFDQMSTRVTAAFLVAAAASPAGVTTYNTSLIRTYNGMVNAMKRATRTFTGPQQGGITQSKTYTPWKNSSPVIIIPPEQLWMWKAALGARYEFNYIETPDYTPQVVVTPMLTNANVFYMVPRGWDQNEHATRVPLQAHGPVDNIEKFAQEMTYRAAYGTNWDPNSIWSCDISTIPSGMTFQIGETNI